MVNSVSRPFAGLVIGAGLVTFAAGVAQAQTMVVATDRQGSLMNRVGTAMAKVMTDHSDMRFVVRPFAGPDAYLDAHNRGEIKLSVLTASSVYLEVTGGNKAKKVRRNFRILRAGPNVLRLGLVVNNDSPIKQVADLKGKKLTSDFGGHSTLPRSIATGLGNGGLTWDDVVKVPVTGVVDGIKTFGAGRVDSSWAAMGMPILREIHAKNKVRFLSFDGSPDKLAKMRQMMFPGLQLAKFPKPIPPLGIMGPTNLITYDTYLMAHKDLDDATAHKITEALWKGTDAFTKASPIFRGFAKKNAVTLYPMVPYHQASAKFYKGQGLWTDAADKASKMAMDIK